MTQTNPKPHLLTSAAELLVHRARAQLQAHLGEPLDGDPAALDHRLNGPEGRAWGRLIELFGVTEPEADLLALALAVAIEPALGPIVAKAQTEGRLLPTEPLIKLLHGHPPRPIWRPTSALAMWRLVTPVRYAPGEPEGYQADRVLADWMFEHLSLDAELVLTMDQLRPGPVPPEWPVEDTAKRLNHALSQGAEVRLAVTGRAGSGRGDFAAAVAGELGREALVADAGVIPQTDWAECFMLAQRFALFADAALGLAPRRASFPRETADGATADPLRRSRRSPATAPRHHRPDYRPARPRRRDQGADHRRPGAADGKRRRLAGRHPRPAVGRSARRHACRPSQRRGGRAGPARSRPRANDRRRARGRSLLRMGRHDRPRDPANPTQNASHSRLAPARS